jgi:hypothetical protein
MWPSVATRPDESLNPAYPSWDLDEEEGKSQVIAEFVRVLD